MISSNNVVYLLYLMIHETSNTFRTSRAHRYRQGTLPRAEWGRICTKTCRSIRHISGTSMAVCPCGRERFILGPCRNNGAFECSDPCYIAYAIAREGNTNRLEPGSTGLSGSCKVAVQQRRFLNGFYAFGIYIHVVSRRALVASVRVVGSSILKTRHSR